MFFNNESRKMPENFRKNNTQKERAIILKHQHECNWSNFFFFYEWI